MEGDNMRYVLGAITGLLAAEVGWILCLFTIRPSFPVWPFGKLSSIPVNILFYSDFAVAAAMGAIIARTLSCDTFIAKNSAIYSLVVAVIIGAATMLANGLTFIPFVVWIAVAVLAFVLLNRNKLVGEEDVLLSLVIGPGVGVGVVSGMLVGLVVAACSLIIVAICVIGMLFAISAVAQDNPYGH